MGRNLTDHSPSPVRDRSYRREKSPARQRRSHRDASPAREKRSGRAKSPKRELPRSPSPPPPREKNNASSLKSPKKEREGEKSRSPSPRSKRLRRAQAEREAERAAATGREYERNHDKGSRRERGEAEKEQERNHRGRDRAPEKERRSGRDDDEVDDVRPNPGRRHGRSSSPPQLDRQRRSRNKSPSRSWSRSPRPIANDRERDEGRNSRGAERNIDGSDSVAKMNAAAEALDEKKKAQPSFELSGKLAEETNRVRGITLQFTEPPDARKPDKRWRLYVFKGGELQNEPYYIHRQSCYLFGRERRVADIPTDHPSCSKQHAVLQFRHVEKEQPDGTTSKLVRPYLMDLGSTNKTYINDNPVEPQRYYELLERDTVKFGNSSREYVLLHENSVG